VGRQRFVAIFAGVRKRPRFRAIAHTDTVDFASPLARILDIDGDLNENGAANFRRKFLRDRFELAKMKAGDDRKKRASDGFDLVLNGDGEQIDDFLLIAGNRRNLLHQNFGAFVHQMGDLVFVGEFDQNRHVSIVDWFEIRAGTERTTQQFENFFRFLARQWNDVAGRLLKRAV